MHDATDMRPRLELWSGGQTGVDRAALDVALELGIPIGGWVPRGRLAEDGRIPARYQGLREAEAADYAVRTRRNVEDSDATLVLRMGAAAGGTGATLDIARRLRRPVLDIDLEHRSVADAAESVRAWLEQLGGARSGLRVNVAGPRASQAPRVYARTREVLHLALAAYGAG